MAKSSPYCPLIKKGCVEHKCAWYTMIAGTDPQTGEVVDRAGCAITFIPMLQIENTKAALATQSATVEVRENVIRAAQATVQAVAQQHIEPAEINLIEQSKD